MASPSERLAQSLEILHGLQNANGAAAIRARDMTRAHRERLLANGFLQEVIKGWYIPSRPDEMKGESTAWYASFWRFCRRLSGKRGSARAGACRRNNRCRCTPGTGPCRGSSPSRSPQRQATRSPSSRMARRCWTSRRPAAAADREEKDGPAALSLEAALIECSPQYFSQATRRTRAQPWPMIRDASGLLAKLLDGGHSTIAGRLAGAFRNSGRDRIADEIVKTMSAAGYAVRENDPFKDQSRAGVIAPAKRRLTSIGIRLLWQKMREPVIERFPKAPGLPRKVDAYMKRVDEAYVTDAYHSLSIEGYRVTHGAD